MFKTLSYIIKRIQASIKYRSREFLKKLQRKAWRFWLTLNRRRAFNSRQKVSIIVPVYNVEEYLRQCLDSILNQTYKNIEVVCVNDCSPDNSLEILKEYAQKDSRVIIVDKPVNEGLPQARKSGLAKASGQWIMMVDSDDWIESNMVESMLTVAVPGGYDMTCCDLFYYYSKDVKNIVPTSCLPKDKFQRIKKAVMGKEFCMGCLPYKFVRKEVYDKIEFPTENMCEDQYISCQLYYYSHSIGRVPLAFYHYCFNEKSLMNDPDKALVRYIEIKAIYERIFKFCRERYGDDLSIFEPELSWRLDDIESQNPEKRKNISEQRSSENA